MKSSFLLTLGSVKHDVSFGLDVTLLIVLQMMETRLVDLFHESHFCCWFGAKNIDVIFASPGFAAAFSRPFVTCFLFQSAFGILRRVAKI